MNEERRKFIEDAVNDGIFVRAVVTVWQPRRELTVGDLKGVAGVTPKDTVTLHRRFKIPCLSRCNRLHTALKLAMGNLSYKTCYGRFVPAPNISRFNEEVEKARQNLADARDEALAEYDQIIESITEQAEELAILSWRDQHGHEGTPHRRFIENYVSDYVESLGTREDARRRFKFRIFPSDPLVSPDSRYAEIYDAEKNNLEVYEAVYDKILNHRRAIVVRLGRAVEKLKKRESAMKGQFCRSVLARVQGSLWAVFYKDFDSDLVEMLEGLQSLLIVADEERTREEFIRRADEICTHIVDHPFFRTGLEVDRG